MSIKFQTSHNLCLQRLKSAQIFLRPQLQRQQPSLPDHHHQHHTVCSLKIGSSCIRFQCFILDSEANLLGFAASSAAVHPKVSKEVHDVIHSIYSVNLCRPTPICLIPPLPRFHRHRSLSLHLHKMPLPSHCCSHYRHSQRLSLLLHSSLHRHQHLHKPT
jgi:hypothetical protein